MNDKETFLLSVLFGVACFFLSILYTFIGGLSGWFVGLVFGKQILGFLNACGIEKVTMFQFGAFLGFVSTFFACQVRKKDD